MSRRATPRPPHLESAPLPRHAQREPRRRSLRAEVVRARLAGRHERLGRSELRSVMRRVVAGDPVTLLGLERFAGADLDELETAAREGWGWRREDPVVSTDPDRLLEGLVEARERVLDVAHRGGRVLVATGRPASLLPVHQALARLARGAGAHLLEADDAGPVPAAGRAGARLWWAGGVAVLTDGEVLLADPGLEAVDELLFTVPHPDLVVADRGFAGGALAAGVEVVALADLDAVALGVAARRGLPVTLVPLQERRPAAAYSVLDPLLAPPRPPEAS